MAIVNEALLPAHLRAVVVVDGTTLAAVGFDGLIARSTDAGASWTRTSSPTRARLYGAAVDGRGRVWAVGESGTILRSDDAGSHFVAEPAPVSSRLVAITSSPPERLVAVGDGGVVLERGAAGWRVVHQAAGGVAGLRVVGAREDGALVAFGYDGFGLREASPGTWQELPRGNTDALYGMTLGGDGQLYACGSFGSIARSSDGGATWTPLPTGSHAFLRAIDVDGSTIVAVGHGAVVRSTDGGATFATVLSRFPAQLLGVAALPGGILIAAGEYGAVLRSSDAGATWSTAVPPAFHLEAIAWADTSSAVAVGQHGRIMRSSDGGTTFAIADSGSVEPLVDVCFWSAKEGLAAARTGVVLRTSDGGAAWAPLALPGKPRLDAVACLPGGGALVAGRDGAYLTSSDGGTTWGPARSPLVARARDLSDGERPWVAAEEGVLGQCRRPGGPWLALYTGTDATLEGVSALGDRLAAVGEGGLLLLSRSGGRGSSLSESHVAGGVSLRAVAQVASAAPAPPAILAVGDAGTIVRSRDDGVSFALVPLPRSSRERDGRPVTLRGIAAGDGSALACGDLATIVRISP